MPVDLKRGAMTMAIFHFLYQAVLTQRERAEQLAQRALSTAQKELLFQQEKLRQLDEQMQVVTRDMRDNHLLGPLDITYIAGHRRYRIGMERSAVETARAIAAASDKVEAARRVQIAAAIDRKSIERLKEKAELQWRQQQSRVDQAAGDEVGMQIAYENLRQSNEGQD